MKKLLIVGLAGVAGLLLGSPASARIPGTAHETSAGVAGACSACHLPHAGGADRLWPSTPGSATYTGVVAGLCSSCHSSTGGYSASMGAAASDGFVFHANSHGTLMARGSTEPWGTAVAASGLPYAAQTGNFECTTCHDVHNDSTRPFLRDSLTQLCARCHTSRHFMGGSASEGGVVTAGAWGTTNVGLANPGSHPVGSDITGDVSGQGSVISIPTTSRVLTSAAVNGWSLGGHLYDGTATGGVTCVSCHAVHGTQIDGDDDTAGQVALTAAAPNANYLVVAQASVSATWTNSRSVANGNGASNTLCESCHGVGNNPGTYTGAYNVNPGGTGTFSHPVDDFPSSYDAGVTAFPTNWPVGAAGGTNVDPAPICESCHTPHPAAELAGGRTDVNAGAGDYILRDNYEQICGNCHTATFAGHHPVGMTYDSTGVNYLTNATGASGDTLECSTCHEQNGAHNWTAAGFVSMDPLWLPTNNGRDTASQANDMFSTDMSKTCMDCHYGMDGDAASLSPTLGTGATVTLEAEYQTVDTSNGTHYIGLIHNPTTADTWKGTGATDANGNVSLTPQIDIFDTTATWADTDSNAAAGWSRFGGTSGAPVIVCETCHEIEPDKNIDSHMLLAPYAEGNNGSGEYAGDTNGRDILCQACHGVPNGTHPVSGMTVSRTGATLTTTAGWLRSTLAGDATMGTNVLSCDSCHQPHDANTNSRTFMLDAPATISGYTVVVGAGVVETTSVSATTDYAEITYATPTLQGRGGDFTGFCDQCHVYAY